MEHPRRFVSWEAWLLRLQVFTRIVDDGFVEPVGIARMVRTFGNVLVVAVVLETSVFLLFDVLTL